MRYRNLIKFAAMLLFVVSCAREVTLDYSYVEQEVFDDWMELYYPELIANKQDTGDYYYYVDIVTVGDTSDVLIADTTCWVKYEITVRNLHGEVTLTRDELIANQQGTFSAYTYYHPFYRYSGDELTSALVSEASYHAMRNALVIGDSDEVYLYNGAEFALYMPSTLMNGEGSGTGGYEGQYELSTTRPMVSYIKIVDVVINPIEDEADDIDAFVAINGGVTNTYVSSDDWVETDEDSVVVEVDPYGNLWRTATDTVPHVYIYRDYEPISGVAPFTYMDEYVSAVSASPYYSGGASALDLEINELLIERFSEEVSDDGDIIDETTVSIWYIGRYLDGFIFDTNIEEIRDLVFMDDDDEGSTSSISFTSSDTGQYIQSWYEVIPKLRAGQWAALITSSSYAYGQTGVSAGTTIVYYTDYSSYYDYSNYYNSYNPYSSSYYSSYYSNYYYNNYSYYNTSSSDDSSSLSITTEIPSYKPMIFQIFIEP